jgi:hypothetical protein
MKITQQTTLSEINKNFLKDFKETLSKEELIPDLENLIGFSMNNTTILENIFRLNRINCIHDEDDDESYNAYTYRQVERPTDRDIQFFRSRPENSKWKLRFKPSDWSSKFVAVASNNKIYFDVFDKTKLNVVQKIAEELISNYGIQTHVNLYAEYEPDLYSQKEVRKMKITSLSFQG